MASLLLFVKEEFMANKVTPLSPKRKKGRPNKVVQQIINLERKIFAAREKVIDAQPEAIETVLDLMKDVKAPPQVRLSSAKEILGYGAQLYQQLVESEQEDSVEQEETPQEQTEKTETNVIDWGEFGNLANNK